MDPSESLSIDSYPRTVGFFLDDDPIIQVCEVTAAFTGNLWVVAGNCSAAQKGHLRCKHTREVAGIYKAAGGHFLVEMDPSVTPEQLEEARRTPAQYRELILHFGVVQVI